MKLKRLFPVTLIVIIFFPPLPRIQAREAGSSELSRFNEVQTWAGNIHAKYTYTTNSGSGRCSKRRVNEVHTFDSFVRLERLDPRRLTTISEEDEPMLKATSQVWGKSTESPAFLPGSTTGTQKQTFKGTYSESCPDFIENVKAKGSGSDRVDGGMLFIQPSMIKTFAGGWYYTFDIENKEIMVHTNGTEKTRIETEHGYKWVTDKINDSGKRSIVVGISPFDHKTTVEEDQADRDLTRNMKTMIPELVQERLAGFAPGLAAEITGLMNEMEEDAPEPAPYEGPRPALAVIPKSGMNLTGNIVKKWSYPGDPGSYTFELNWNFRPDKSVHYELEVEVEGYDHWLPKGSKNADEAGNLMVIHARLIDPKTGKLASAAAKRLVFELVESSKEQGVAVNRPIEGADTAYDMRFEKKDNPDPDIQITNEGLKLEFKEIKFIEQRVFPHEPVALASYDWGGYAKLKVTAYMAAEDGEYPIEGYLKGGDKSKKYILLPKRDEKSHIADFWKEKAGAQGKADAADDESDPQGDGHDGDGFTLYEEYRGFYSSIIGEGEENGHLRMDPKKKEVFVQDKIKSGYSGGGIGLYQQLSALMVHFLGDWDLHSTRAVNINSTNDGFNYQYAIVLNLNDGTDSRNHLSDAAGWTYRGTPFIGGNVQIAKPSDEDGERAVAYRGEQRFETNYTAVVVAHEMLHSSVVDHHGKNDLARVTWKAYQLEDDSGESAPAILEFSKEGIKKVRIFLEGIEGPAGEVTPESIGSEGVILWVARQHGQHSGYEDCVMRYAVADAHIPEGNENVRIWHDSNQGEIKGMGICETAEGTGLAGQRYGSAALGRCKKQICINDRFASEHKR